MSMIKALNGSTSLQYIFGKFATYSGIPTSPTRHQSRTIPVGGRIPCMTMIKTLNGSTLLQYIFVSNDPSWWTLINSIRINTYFIAASTVVVELIWRQRWSFTTALFLGVRYIGILFAAYVILPSISLTNKLIFSGEIIDSALWCIGFVVNCMLDVITIARLFAMYQQSRKVLILLVVTFLAIAIACGVIAAIQIRQILGDNLILPGTHQCIGEGVPLTVEFWSLGTAWEVFTLCLALWSAIKHFRELQQPWKRWTIWDCFTVLIKSHVLYFARLAHISNENSTTALPWIYGGAIRIFSNVQMFILGPRLLLDVRKYHARLVDDSDAGTVMSMMVFHEHVQVIGSDV
ncbi:hypothetical protein BDR07DRAFT_1403675 [Suillus spraguei]|nr:hypothetical protein BDR07DRAFT_1403675 [Suillus spraguei]